MFREYLLCLLTLIQAGKTNEKYIVVDIFILLTLTQLFFFFLVLYCCYFLACLSQSVDILILLMGQSYQLSESQMCLPMTYYDLLNKALSFCRPTLLDYLSNDDQWSSSNYLWYDDPIHSFIHEFSTLILIAMYLLSLLVHDLRCALTILFFKPMSIH